MLLKTIVICSMVAAPSALEASARLVSNPYPDVMWEKFDEYSDISSKKEKFRLNNFAIQLLQEKSSNAFIVAHAGRRSCKGEAQARADRAKSYLVQSGGIEASRIHTIVAGYEEKWTIELFMASGGVRPLTLADLKGLRNEVPANRVQILGDCKKKIRTRL